MPEMGFGSFSDDFTFPALPFLTLSYRSLECIFSSRLSIAGADNVKFPGLKCLRKWKVQVKVLIAQRVHL